MIKVIQTIILLFLITKVFSQEKKAVDTLKFNRLSNFQVASLGVINYSTSELKGVIGDIQLLEYDVKLNFAIKNKPLKTFMLNRVAFNMLEYKYSNEFAKSSNRFYVFSYNIGILKVLKNRWLIVGMLNPTFASDLNKSVSSEDFILQSTLIFRKRANLYFEYGFGLSFNTRFGRELLVPLISVDYKKGNWSSSNLIPGYISGYYHFNKSKIGFSADIYGNVYNSSSQNLTSAYEIDKTSYTRITVGPRYQLKLYDDFYLNLGIGICIFNRLESFDRNSVREIELSTKEKFFFKVAIELLK